MVSRLAERITGHDVKPQLIKRPGASERTRGDGPLRAYFVHTSRTRPWARRVDFHDLAELLAFDVTAVERPEPPSFGTPVDHNLYLVCTHAKKDPCCAMLGRPVASALGAAGRAEVWETTHVGGDRFAANLVALPQGVYFGRLEPESAARTVDAFERGLVLPENYRGRCTDSSPAQAAEAALRAWLGVPVGVNALTHLSEEETADGVRLTLGHGGGLYSVTVETVEGQECPTTCSALSPTRPVHHRVREISRELPSGARS